MAKASKAIINRLNTLMVQARNTHSEGDLMKLLEFRNNCAECYGEEMIYMNFSNAEMVIIDEAKKLFRTRGVR